MSTNNYLPTISIKSYNVEEVTLSSQKTNDIWLKETESSLSRCEELNKQNLKIKSGHKITIYEQVFPSGHCVIEKIVNHSTNKTYPFKEGIPKNIASLIQISILICALPVVGFWLAQFLQLYISKQNRINLNKAFSNIATNFNAKLFAGNLLLFLMSWQSSLFSSYTRMLTVSILLFIICPIYFVSLALLTRIRIKHFIRNKDKINDNSDISVEDSLHTDTSTRNNKCNTGFLKQQYSSNSSNICSVQIPQTIGNNIYFQAISYFYFQRARLIESNLNLLNSQRTNDFEHLMIGTSWRVPRKHLEQSLNISYKTLSNYESNCRPKGLLYWPESVFLITDKRKKGYKPYQLLVAMLNLLEKSRKDEFVEIKYYRLITTYRSLLDISSGLCIKDNLDEQ